MGTTHPGPLQRRTNVRGAISVAIGLCATACAVAAIVTSDMIVATCAVAVALVGFPMGWRAHTRALTDTQVSKRSALAGEVLNFAPWALLIVWGLLIYTLALVTSG